MIVSTLTLQHVKTAMDPTVRTSVEIDTVVHLVRHVTHRQEAVEIRERERNVLFNDALNTFDLRLYGVRYMFTDHSDSEKGNPLPPHRLLLSIYSKGSFISTIPHT